MVVIELTLGQLVMGFASLLREFHMEGALSRTLFVTFHALVGRFPLLTSIAIEDIDAIAVWIVSLGSLRDHLDVLRSKDFIDFLSYLLHIIENHILEYRHVNINYSSDSKVNLLFTMLSSSSSPIPSSLNSLSSRCLLHLLFPPL